MAHGGAVEEGTGDGGVKLELRIGRWCDGWTFSPANPDEAEAMFKDKRRLELDWLEEHQELVILISDVGARLRRLSGMQSPHFYGWRVRDELPKEAWTPPFGLTKFEIEFEEGEADLMGTMSLPGILDLNWCHRFRKGHDEAALYEFQARARAHAAAGQEAAEFVKCVPSRTRSLIDSKTWMETIRECWK